MSPLAPPGGIIHEDIVSFINGERIKMCRNPRDIRGNSRGSARRRLLPSILQRRVSRVARLSPSYRFGARSRTFENRDRARPTESLTRNLVAPRTFVLRFHKYTKRISLIGIIYSLIKRVSSEFLSTLAPFRLVPPIEETSAREILKSKRFCVKFNTSLLCRFTHSNFYVNLTEGKYVNEYHDM